MVLSNTDLKAKIAQRFMISLPGTSLDNQTKNLIKEYKISNFLLSANNIENINQLKSLCKDIHNFCLENTDHKAIIAISEDGANDTNLKSDFAIVPSPVSQAASGYLRNAYLSGKIIAKQLSYCGINLNIAPCANLHTNKQNTYTALHSYSASADLAAKMCIEFQRAHSQEGIISCAKYFPSLEDDNAATHKSKEELFSSEIIAFKMLIQAGLPAILLENNKLYAIDSQMGCNTSFNIVQKFLRHDLGFNGLCISDCLNAELDAKEIEKAFLAGADIIICKNDSTLLSQMLDNLYNHIENWTEDNLTIHTESFERILRYKDRIEFNTSDISLHRMKLSADEIYYSSIKKPFSLPHLGEKPIVFACDANDINTLEQTKNISFAKSLGKYFACENYVFSNDPKLSEIRSLCKAAEDATCIVFASQNAHINIGQLKLYQHLKKLNKAIIFFAMANPYDLSLDTHNDNIAKIALYEYTKRSIKYAIKMLEDNEDARYDSESV